MVGRTLMSLIKNFDKELPNFAILVTNIYLDK